VWEQVQFAFAPETVNVILKQPAGNEKGIPQGNHHIFVGMIEMVLLVDHDFGARHEQVDANRIEPPVAVMAVWLSNDHMAAGDAVIDAFQIGDSGNRLVADLLVDGDTIKTNLGLGLHGHSPGVTAGL
jgi:hypothetical protein